MRAFHGFLLLATLIIGDFGLGRKGGGREMLTYQREVDNIET